MQHAVLLHGVITRLFRDDAVRDAPDFFRMFAVLGVGHRHVGRQAVGEGSHLTRRAAGRGLAGQRERAVARLGNLSRQQMNVIDHLVGPDAANMLVEPHGPERHDLAFRVGIKLGQFFQKTGFHAGHGGGFFQRVFGDELLEGLEIDRFRLGRISGIRGIHLHRVVRPQAVTDIGDAAHEFRVVLHEILVDASGLDNVVGDIIEDDEIRTRLEDHRDIGKVHAAMGEGRKHRHLHMVETQTPVGDAGP
ncbi:hypothetical protein D3C86_1347120 [compost metagenome]